MAGNMKVLELWMAAISAELEELLGVSVTARAVGDIPPAAGAYRSMLLVEGLVHGVMYATTSSAAMVEFAQMAAGDPLDARAAWTGEALEAWRRLLDAAGSRLATQLTEEFAGSAPGRCTVLLAETAAVDEMMLASGPGTAASGATVQPWIFQAGESEIAISVSVQVEFSKDPLPASATSEAQPAGDAPISGSTEELAAKKNTDTDQSQENRELIAENQGQNQREESADAARQSSVADPAARTVEAPREDQRPVQERPTGRKSRRLDLLLDIELEATLRFGALELPLREVLELGPGDVLPLDRHVREPVDLVVGDRIVARGEVVLVGGNFGLHVTEVAEPRNRLETIRCLF
ncbi:MAG TPA: FliM/FliN family flagellar motor C-terminal domain-containing protein [Acidobacteriaceae bacterium]|nr:FliM/FliN family flagellar motor C-terminal domain-containing protein [Acidobacteriaceae bacterium]